MGGALKAKHYIFVGGGRAVFFFQSSCVCVCVCSNIFSETTGPTAAKFHVEPPWDRGRKFIQMVQVIIVNLLGAGAFCRGFTINVSPQCRAFSRALKTEKLKAPLFPGPGAGTTNDWCIIKPW